MIARIQKQRTFAILAQRDFRRLLTGTVLWWQCFFMEMVVLGWLVFDLTDSARMVSLVAFCRTLPLLLVSLFSGAIIDHIGRRRVVIAAQGVNLLAYLALMALLWSGLAAPWNIALVALSLGTAWSLDWPARRALIPDLIGKEQMIEGIVLESVITGVARIIAPSLAGALIAQYGALGCYSVMAILSGCALSILFPLLRSTEIAPTRPPKVAALPLAREGLRYVRSNQAILAVILITLIMNLWLFPYVSLLPIFARDVLRTGPAELGFLNTGTALGSFIGLLTVNMLRQRINTGLLFAIGTGWMCLAFVVFALSQSYPLSWLMLFCAGIGMSFFGTLQSTIILQATSDEMRSRVMGILVLAIGGDPLGQLQIGALAEWIGVQATLAGQATAGLLAMILIIVRLPGVLKPAPRS